MLLTTRRTRKPRKPRATPEDIAQRQHYGQRIAELLKERHTGPTELSKATGISRGQIYRIIKGDYTMRFTTLEAICKALGVSSLDGEPQPDPDTMTVTPKERKLLLMYREVQPHEQDTVLKQLALLYAGLRLDNDE